MLNTIEEVRGDEPQEFKGLSKSKIYQNLSRQYVLPDKDARCVTRAYLATVLRGTVFRMDRTELLNFEVGLTFEERVKASFFHLGILKQRTELLLAQLGQPGFGFAQGTNADEDWMVRIIRLLDPYNILGAFRSKIHTARVPPRISAGRM